MSKSSYSVIIPCKNGKPELVEHLIRSLNEAGKDHELQISLMLTGEIQPIMDLNLESRFPELTLYYPKAGSVGDSRNFGLKKSFNEYVLFLDADDYVDQQMFTELDKATVTKPDLILFGFYKERAGDNLEGQIILPDRNRSLGANICLLDGGAVCWNKAHRRDTLVQNNLGFDPDLNLAEDVEFESRVIPYVKKWTVVEKPLYHYIVYSTSVSQKYRSDMHEQYLKSMERFEKNIALSEAEKTNVILQNLIYTLLKHTFHPDNGSYLKQKEEASWLMSQPVYKTALQKRDMLSLSMGKKLILLSFQTKFYFPISAASKLYTRRNTK